LEDNDFIGQRNAELENEMSRINALVEQMNSGELSLKDFKDMFSTAIASDDRAERHALFSASERSSKPSYFRAALKIADNG
jgi:exonuclease VII small subunit